MAKSYSAPIGCPYEFYIAFRKCLSSRPNKIMVYFFILYKIISLSIFHSVEHLIISMLTISMYDVYTIIIDFLQIKIVMDRNQQSQTVHPGYHMMTPDVPAEEDSEDYV